jgi:hypothetical protein
MDVDHDHGYIGARNKSVMHLVSPTNNDVEQASKKLRKNQKKIMQFSIDKFKRMFKKKEQKSVQSLRGLSNNDIQRFF